MLNNIEGEGMKGGGVEIKRIEAIAVVKFFILDHLTIEVLETISF